MHRQEHFLTPFLMRGHNFNQTKLVGVLCKFTDLRTCSQRDDIAVTLPKGRQ